MEHRGAFTDDRREHEVRGGLADAFRDRGEVVLSRVERQVQLRELLAAANSGDLNSSAFYTTKAFDVVRELEMKNFYSIGGYGIDPKSFTLTIQKGRDVPPVQYADGPGGVRLNYIEVLGLDYYD